MKKIYLLTFSALLLLCAGTVRAQNYYSITSNPGNLNFADPGFWVGGVPPPSPCTGCSINIYASTTMDPADGADIVVTNGTIHLYNNVIFTINTYLELNNTQVTVGNDPSTPAGIILNDQVKLDALSSIRLANDQTYINTNNDDGNAVHQHFDDIGTLPRNTYYSAGIYQPVSPAQGGYDHTAVLTNYGLGSAQSGGDYGSQYNINCNQGTVTTFPNACTAGFVYGPALTGTDPAQTKAGTVFRQSVTLPVELIQFLANKNADGSVKVIWATAIELNAAKYEVERSNDKASFDKIGEVAAKGNSTLTTNYFYTDRSPLSGTSFYRLKMIDLDGKFKYSPVAIVTSDADNTPLVIYSNPFSEQIRVKVNVAKTQTLTITVSDVLGKNYIRQAYNAGAGNNLINLVPAHAASGVYILKIHGTDYDQSVKLIKQ